MTYYAQLNADGICTSITETHSPLPTAANIIEIDGYHTEYAGKLYDAQASTTEGKPVFVDAPAQPQPAPAWEWLIDIGPFFDRFGAAKMAVLTSSDVGVQAIIKDTQVRKWLDLKLPEIASAVAYVGTKVPSVTQELQQSILNTPVEEKENLALRKLYFS